MTEYAIKSAENGYLVQKAVEASDKEGDPFDTMVRTVYVFGTMDDVLEWLKSEDKNTNTQAS